MSSKETANVSTQCCMYMLNRPKTSSKGVTVNIKESKPKCKHVASQVKILPTAAQKPSTSTGGAKPTRRRSVETQCSVPTTILTSRTIPTQTETTGVASKYTQCGEEEISTKCIEQAFYVLRTVPEFWNLSYEVLTGISGNQLLLMCRYDLNGLYLDGQDAIRITLDDRGVCCVTQIFMVPKIKTILKDDVNLDIDAFMDIIRPLCKKTLTFCPGLLKTSEIEGNSTIGSTRKQSEKCPVWYNTDKNPPKSRCLNCKRKSISISKSLKRKSLETPSKKFQRRQISSNYSFRKLTPKSKSIRLQRLKQARAYAQKKYAKLQAILNDKAMTLNEDQTGEMKNIMQIINQNFQDDLAKAFETAGDKEKRQLLQDLWEQDSEAKQKSDKLAFEKDQSKFKTGETTNRWSSITYRIALAVYCRSPAAYNALKSFKILQLPSIRSLQSRTSKFLDNPGINQSYIKEQSEQYNQFKLEKLSKGEKEPRGEGILIFDEVKVIDKVMWNSKNHEFFGLAMTADDFSYLNDIFNEDSRKPSEPKAAKYMLQFVWRDLTSDYDIIGPYFSSVDPLKHQQILGCVLASMRAFHAYDFKVKALVCDGASENLAVVKTTLQHKGVFGFKKLQDESYDFSINPSFQNPFSPQYKCFWIICPSHQLKNMISALHSSREQGAKQFKRNDAEFGWQQIQNMKSREEERFQQGQLRVIPGLTKAYIIRDSWTRLNVKPSKIMQQEAVLSELYEYAQGNTKDCASTLETYKYLRACNQLFENGMLSKHKVESKLSDPMQSLLSGYKYFKDWLLELFRENSNFNPNSGKQTQFLAWQTWDLLRICVFGFEGLVEDFLRDKPDYFLVLSRVNGSVVETLFSQFKYATGSKLSSVNYAQARKSIMVKSSVQGSHPSNQDYRDVPLYIREKKF